MVAHECAWLPVICGSFNWLHMCEYIASVLCDWGGSGTWWFVKQQQIQLWGNEYHHFYYLYIIHFVYFIEIFLGHLSFVKTINCILCAQLFAIFQTESAEIKHCLKRENKVNEIKVLWILIIGALSLEITNSNTFEDWARTKSTGTRYCNVCTVMIGCHNCSLVNRNQVAYILEFIRFITRLWMSYLSMKSER